jgi:hypothetical protein
LSLIDALCNRKLPPSLGTDYFAKQEAQLGYLNRIKSSYSQELPLTTKTSISDISALHLASESGHIEVVDHILLNKGQVLLQIKARKMFEELTPLGIACLHKRATVVNSLLEVDAEQQMNITFKLKNVLSYY